MFSKKCQVMLWLPRSGFTRHRSKEAATDNLRADDLGLARQAVTMLICSGGLHQLWFVHSFRTSLCSYDLPKNHASHCKCKCDIPLPVKLKDNQTVCRVYVTVECRLLVCYRTVAPPDPPVSSVAQHVIPVTRTWHYPWMMPFCFKTCLTSVIALSNAMVVSDRIIHLAVVKIHKSGT